MLFSSKENRTVVPHNIRPLLSYEFIYARRACLTNLLGDDIVYPNGLFNKWLSDPVQIYKGPHDKF